MDDHAAIADRIRRFITLELGWDGSAQELTDDLELLEQGVLDSLGVYELVRFLEDELAVEIDDEELVPENFATIGDVSRLVATKSVGG